MVWCIFRAVGSTPGREACSRHIQCQPGLWRGSRDLGFPTFRPWPGSLHPHRRFKVFRHRPQAGGPGPSGCCLDRHATTLNPFPRHHRLCRITSSSPPPTTAAGNRRPAGLPCIPVHRWGVLHPEPQTPPGTTPGTVFPMARQAQGFRRKPTPHPAPVATSLRKASPVSAWGALPFPQAPCNGNRETLPAPGRTPLPVPADSPDSPI